VAKKHADSLIPVERVERALLFVRGHEVILDRDLAELYGVKAIALRQQISRNKARFPPDFMFRLSQEEAEALVSQNVIPSKRSLGGCLPPSLSDQGDAGGGSPRQAGGLGRGADARPHGRALAAADACTNSDGLGPPASRLGPCLELSRAIIVVLVQQSIVFRGSGCGCRLSYRHSPNRIAAVGRLLQTRERGV
jgi:hypothetical protein